MTVFRKSIMLLTAAVLIASSASASADCAHQIRCGSNTCTICGESGVTGTVIHSYTRSNYSATQHVVKCTNCGDVHGYEEHSYSCATNICSGCGAKVTGGNVSHSWTGNVKLDDTYHINTCSACGKTSKEAHEVTSTGACTGCNATGLKPGNAKPGTSTSSGKKPSKPKATPTPSIASNVYLNGSEVTVVKLGIVETEILINGSSRKVPTIDLTFENEAPDDQKLAVIQAPRAGKVSLRKTTSKKSAIRAKCESGTIVTVLKIEDKLAYINYLGKEGYVSVRDLMFLKPQEAKGTLMLHYQGKTSGKKKINIRTTDSNKSYKVMQLPTGTVLNYLSGTEKWYMVEYDGHVGYVQAQFINVLSENEPAATAARDAEYEEDASAEVEANDAEDDDLMIEEEE